MNTITTDVFKPVAWRVFATDLRTKYVAVLPTSYTTHAAANAARKRYEETEKSPHIKYVVTIAL